MNNKDKPTYVSPPHSKEAEMMVLGQALLGKDSLLICGGLLPHSFYYKEHRVIFEAIKAVFSQHRVIDSHLTSLELKNRDQLTEVGGLAYLMQLSQYVGTGCNTEAYIKLVNNKFKLRQLIEEYQVLTKKAFDEEPVSKILSYNFNKCLGIDKDNIECGWYQFKDFGFTKSDLLEMHTAAIEGVRKDIILTGFIDLDKLIDGFKKSNLIIFAGRPGMGKTSFALNIAEYAAITNNKKVGIVSLEMDKHEIYKRFIGSLSKVSFIDIKKWEPKDIEAASEAILVALASNIFIYDKPLTMNKLAIEAMLMKNAYNLDLLIVDYLQLIDMEVNKSYSRYDKITEISRSLQILAKELEIPILCGSQLSRNSDQRIDKRPVLSDLRDSGAIEQDANIVLLLHRPSYYKSSDMPGVAEVIVAKNRSGPTGTVKLTFLKEYARFENFHPLDATDNKAHIYTDIYI